MPPFVCSECGLSAPTPGHCTEDGHALADAGDDSVLGLVLGSYRVTRLIGAGGMGRVYRGVHPGIGSRVAVKVLSYEFASSAAAVERFFAEARAVNLIRHENIVNVIDLAKLPDGRPYIVMEYLDGRSLAELLRERGPMPLGWLARLGDEVLDALAAAHERGIVHRDLKPDNVFVTPGGHAKVLDFGIAKLRPDATSTPQTATGALLGTPHYMSPEQALGRAVDARSDFYSLGVLLYECATGRKPFEAESLYELLRYHVESSPEPPARFRPDLPAAFEQLLLRALAKDPSLRFQTAREMQTALHRIAGFLPADGAGHASHPPLTPAGASAPLEPTRGVPTFSPEAPAAASSIVTTRSEPEARSPAKSALPWVVAGGFGVLFLLAIAALGIALFARPAPTTARGGDGVITVPVPKKEAAGGKVHAPLEPISYLDEATKTARSYAPDATLASIVAFHVGRDGYVNFDGSGHRMVEYQFISPSRAKRWMNDPIDKKTQCIIRIDVEAKSTTSRFTDGECDTYHAIPRPRCDYPKMMKRVLAAGAPADVPDAAQFNWSPGADDKPRWWAEIGSFKHAFPDEC